MTIKEKKLTNSKTLENLKKAFAGESQARNNYSFFASQARKDGFNQIANVFENFANQEKEHAKIWFKLINNGLQPTVKNLLTAARNENYEHTSMYKEMAQTAKKEGFTKIANLFLAVGKIEAEHEAKYLKLFNNIKTKNIYSHKTKIGWQCQNCGWVTYAKTAPLKCEVCNHSQAYQKKINCCCKK